MIEEIQAWCEGKVWWWRLLLLAGLAYIGITAAVNPQGWSVFGGVTLGIHELGHFLFRALGEFMGVAGGTIAQLAAPIICIVMFVRQGDYFAPVLGGVWLATSLANVSVYIADATRLELPLVSVGGGEVMHDWEYMLSSLNILSSADNLARLVAFLGYAVLFVSLAYGGWTIYLMAKSKNI